jgi:hypothetical protein
MSPDRVHEGNAIAAHRGCEELFGFRRRGEEVKVTLAPWLETA